MLECVVNVSEGRDRGGARRAGGGRAAPTCSTVHEDPDHHRSVFTLVGEAAPRALATRRRRPPRPARPRRRPPPPGRGRRGAVRAARRRHAGRRRRRPGRLRPVGRRGAGAAVLPLRARAARCPRCAGGPSSTSAPDAGPPTPHPSAGATAWAPGRSSSPTTCGWPSPTSTAARRGGGRRALAGGAGPRPARAAGRVQVSMNLVDPGVVGPAAAFDAVAAQVPVAGAELVGLVPRRAGRRPAGPLRRARPRPDRTIEARLAPRSSVTADGPRPLGAWRRVGCGASSQAGRRSGGAVDWSSSSEPRLGMLWRRRPSGAIRRPRRASAAFRATASALPPPAT